MIDQKEHMMTAKAVTELDDIGAYEATLTDEHRSDLAAASVAMDLYILLHRARESRGLSQAAAADLAGLHQQAVSRLEQSTANPQFGKIVHYLNALGYGLELRAVDLDTGEAVAEVMLGGDLSAANDGAEPQFPRPRPVNPRESASRPGRMRKSAQVLA